jgi:hypothetical protein
MAEDEKEFIYKGGVRFEVTSYGLVCCLEESKNKKHQCPDCKFCQWCSNLRCSGCLDQGRYDREANKKDLRERKK